MSITNPKSRGNFGFKYTTQQYEAIFGGKSVEAVGKQKAPSLYTKATIEDGPNGKDILKIGREINRFKKLDGANVQGIKQRFENDTNKMFEKKTDSGLIGQISHEVAEQLKRR